jgi:hypothetical protein
MTKRAVASVAELRQHAYQLAAAFGVRLIETDIRPEDAFAAKGDAVCGQIVDETTYAIALHELGHVAAPTGSLRAAGVEGERTSLQRVEEDAAWTWARYYALVWSPAMEHLAQWAEGTYKAQQPERKWAAGRQIEWSQWK